MLFWRSSSGHQGLIHTPIINEEDDENEQDTFWRIEIFSVDENHNGAKIMAKNDDHKDTQRSLRILLSITKNFLSTNKTKH